MVLDGVIELLWSFCQICDVLPPRNHLSVVESCDHYNGHRWNSVWTEEESWGHIWSGLGYGLSSFMKYLSGKGLPGWRWHEEGTEAGKKLVGKVMGPRVISNCLSLIGLTPRKIIIDHACNTNDTHMGEWVRSCKICCVVFNIVVWFLLDNGPFFMEFRGSGGNMYVCACVCYG